MDESALPIDDDKYTCETCGRTWKNRAYLKQHQATCSLGKVTSFFICLFAFFYLSGYMWRLSVDFQVWADPDEPSDQVQVRKSDLWVSCGELWRQGQHLQPVRLHNDLCARFTSARLQDVANVEVQPLPLLHKGAKENGPAQESTAQLWLWGHGLHLLWLSSHCEQRASSKIHLAKALRSSA